MDFFHFLVFLSFFYLFISQKSSNFALVIELDRHIEILLLGNDCVIVPGLGGFMAHHADARYDEEDVTRGETGRRRAQGSYEHQPNKI